MKYTACIVIYGDRKMENKRWTRDRVIAHIKRRFLRGLSLSIRDVYLEEPALFHVARHSFGSWVEALKAANIAYGDFSSWEKAVKEAGVAPPAPKGKEAIITAIHERVTAGLSLDLRAVKKSNFALYEAALKEFGSWYAAVRTAGYRLS